MKVPISRSYAEQFCFVLDMNPSPVWPLNSTLPIYKYKDECHFARVWVSQSHLSPPKVLGQMQPQLAWSYLRGRLAQRKNKTSKILSCLRVINCLSNNRKHRRGVSGSVDPSKQQLQCLSSYPLESNRTTDLSINLDEQRARRGQLAGCMVARWLRATPYLIHIFPWSNTTEYSLVS